MRPMGWLRVWYLILSLTFLAGIFFGLFWLSAFSLSIGALLLTAHLWRNGSLVKVEYHRRWRFHRGFPGEKIEVQIVIKNRKILPLSWLRATDPWPLAVGPEDQGILAPYFISDTGLLVNLCSLRWHDAISRSYLLELRQRGIFAIGPVTLSAGDPFGFFEQSIEQTNQQYLTVFPEILPLVSLQLQAEDPFGDRRSRRRLFEDPNQPMGIRDYLPGDAFRRIHWAATARTGNLQVKVYQPVSSRVMLVCMNVTTTSQPWLGSNTQVLEQLVKVSASLIYHSAQDGYAVGLISNGCLAHADRPFSILPGRSTEQLALLLQTLAAVTPFTTAPFESFLVKTMGAIPFGAVLVIVTAIVNPLLVQTLLRIRQYRTHTTLISLETTPPPDLPGIRTIHLPLQSQ